MKHAHIATRWIGEGAPEDKYRADLPEGYTRATVLGDQYVNLALDCPRPNIALVRVEESRAKHEGYIDSLKSNLNQIVLEEWEDDFPALQVASEVKVKNFLVRQGMDEALAIVEAPEGRVAALLNALDVADKRARRRIEIERGSR